MNKEQTALFQKRYTQNKHNKNFFWQWGAGFALLVLLAWVFSNIVTYIIISLILSAILSPIVNYLSELQVFKVKIPRLLAVLLAFSLLILVGSLFATLFVPLIYDQVQLLSAVDYGDIIESVTIPIENFETFLRNTFQIDAPKGFLMEEISKVGVSLIERFQFAKLINNLISITGSISVALLAITFITFFLLYEKGIIRNRIIEVIPNPYFEVMITTIYKIERLLSNYLLGILLETISIFSIIALGLTLLDIQYAITIGVFAALVNFIPYIGPLSGYLFGLFVGLSTANLSMQYVDSTIIFIKISSVYLTARLIDDLILQPVIFSKSIKAHPLEVFLAIFAGATLAGPLGMILAIPSYTILRVIFREFRIGYRQYHVFKQGK
ncbi:MAG: AI-2E family transporter [Thermonemataceae bacterium]